MKFFVDTAEIDEIKELNENHLSFKDEIVANHRKFEKLIDEAADEISNFL